MDLSVILANRLFNNTGSGTKLRGHVDAAEQIELAAMSSLPIR